MREIRVSSTLTVYHDGQFWVGMFECAEEGRLSACRVVFGAEPSAQEILQLVCERWSRLRFTEPIGYDEAPRIASNPKRRQREAARELGRRGPSTPGMSLTAYADGTTFYPASTYTGFGDLGTGDGFFVQV